MVLDFFQQLSQEWFPVSLAFSLLQYISLLINFCSAVNLSNRKYNRNTTDKSKAGFQLLHVLYEWKKNSSSKIYYEEKLEQKVNFVRTETNKFHKLILNSYLFLSILLIRVNRVYPVISNNWIKHVLLSLVVSWIWQGVIFT